jgi:hypothetical protein
VYDDDEDEGGRFRQRRGSPEPAQRGFLSRIGWWLTGAIITGIVPLAVSLWALSAVTDYAPAIAQATPLAAAGTALVVAVSFSLALFVELYAYWKMGPSAGREDGAPITGRLQFLIVYVLVPLVPGLVAGYLTLRPAARLSQAIEWVRQPAAAQVERQVGQAIQDAAAAETRVAGLRALAQFGSQEALGELARLAAKDPRLLNDASAFDAAADALASFGSRAEPVLNDLWKSSKHAAGGDAQSGARTPADLVLAAFNKLDTVAAAAAAYSIAREAAEDPASSPERQAAAIALIARCGSKSDFTLLASFLATRPEPVKRAALDALRHLDARLKKQEPASAPNAPAPNAPAPAGR